MQKKKKKGVLEKLAKSVDETKGEPSYISATQKWKGAKANLNKKPVIIKDIPKQLLYQG